MRERKTKLVRAALAAAVTCASLELASYASARVLRERLLFYRAPGHGGLTAHLARRDPVLGWLPPKERWKGDLDASGSRVVPAFPDPASPACASLYGDSFTWGEEVEPEDAWG